MTVMFSYLVKRDLSRVHMLLYSSVHSNLIMAIKRLKKDKKMRREKRKTK